jgi:broad specificity polyphosphatase/5'/3'-nucleotidase SurE
MSHHKTNNIPTVNKQQKYVVTRNGYRVSDNEYFSIEDAENEALYWKDIIKKWPDGSKILVEEYNDKKHRVY